MTARRSRRRALVLCVLMVSWTGASAQAEGDPLAVLIERGASWRYVDDGAYPGDAWRERDFDDSEWKDGPAEFAYDDAGGATPIGSASRESPPVTTWFRHAFEIDAPSSIHGLTLRILRDDGAAVYLNGEEIYRTNLPPGALRPGTLASIDAVGLGEGVFFEAPVAPSLLVPGRNVVTVELHQHRPGSPDLHFDLELYTSPPSPEARLVRGPYLQRGTPNGAVIRWRTDIPTRSVLAWGAAPDALPRRVVRRGFRTEHEVALTDLEPATVYFYALEAGDAVVAGGDGEHFFRTLPPPDSHGLTRIWVIGDSGQCGATAQGCTNAAAVRDAYLSWAGRRPADVWLMLGDNAYKRGTDAEYTAAVFDVYPSILRNTFLWPAPGNHEFGHSDSSAQSGPYYDAFTLPSRGEAGGLPSGTEAYYSFDYGPVHFVALDSHDTDRSVDGPMYQWLDHDLASTDRDFTIVYWHHPPYTKGGHDSDDPRDSGGRMREMREHFVPLLERHGADLQLTGHSHSYERSMLIDGHHDTSNTLRTDHLLDTGDGDPEGDGPYHKATPGPAPHEGAVYSVVGSSSKTTGGLTRHPIMIRSLNILGSLVVDVEGLRLRGTFLDADGNERDHFEIWKGPACSADAPDAGMCDSRDDGSSAHRRVRPR